MAAQIQRVIIVGGGVAGSEAGTYLGQHARQPLEIIEIEQEPERKFGGWGFQGFPVTETTNLALRKMYLGDDPEEILRWVNDPAVRASWPEQYRAIALEADRPFPRILMKRYVMWRRAQVNNPLVRYTSITGEADRVSLPGSGKVEVGLADGRVVTAEQLVMASGSITVKVPEYLQEAASDARVIIDPLTREGHDRRAAIPAGARVLVLGTGLTGEEQVNILLKHRHTDVTLLSREGLRHYAYPQDQKNKALHIDGPPAFFSAETPEEFRSGLEEFYAYHLGNGHSPEDIIAAIRPMWDGIRAGLGGCVKAAERLHQFKRTLAVNSIGTSWEVSENTRTAEQAGYVRLWHGYISAVKAGPDGLMVSYRETPASDEKSERFDWIINAVGRNIIRHSIWEQLLRDGIANKHAGIGVRVTETGQLMAADGSISQFIAVVGMPRAGDHALRHGYLGNTAFNVPQVRSHCYSTMAAVLDRLEPAAMPELKAG